MFNNKILAAISVHVTGIDPAFDTRKNAVEQYLPKDNNKFFSKEATAPWAKK